MRVDAWWLLAATLLFTACAVDYRVGRDALAVTTWEQRGETVGDLAYIYCSRAAPREKLIFQWGLQRTRGPYRLVISCDPDLQLGPTDG